MLYLVETPDRCYITKNAFCCSLLVYQELVDYYDQYSSTLFDRGFDYSCRYSTCFTKTTKWSRYHWLEYPCFAFGYYTRDILLEQLPLMPAVV